MVLPALFPPYRGIPRELRHPDMERHGTPHLSAMQGVYRKTEQMVRGGRGVTERVFPDSPFICKSCGKDVDGSITIEGKGICADCFKRFGLEEKLGITVEELFEVKE